MPKRELSAHDLRRAIIKVLDNADVYQLVDLYNTVVQPEEQVYADDLIEETVIDLDADSWASLKNEIQEAPRFQGMYAAGGTFTDALSVVRSWLSEPVIEESPTRGM